MIDLPVNGARGEVALRIGGVPLVIAAEMERLAAVSTALECKSLADLFTRLSSVEPAAMMVAIPLLAIRGDAGEAMKRLKLRDFKAIADAVNAALAHHFRDDEGNGEAAANGAA